MKSSYLFVVLMLFSTNSYASILRFDLAGIVNLYSNPNNMGVFTLIEENVPYTASFIIETNTLLSQNTGTFSGGTTYNFNFSPYGAQAKISNSVGKELIANSEDELSIQVANNKALNDPTLFDFIPGYQFNSPHDRIEISSFTNNSVGLIFSIISDTSAFNSEETIPSNFPLSQTDLNIFAYRDFGNDVDAVGLASTFNVTVIPIPASYYLFSVGLLMLYSRFKTTRK